MNSELSPRFPEVIDSTMRNDFVSCGVKFMLARVYGLAAKGGSVHLVAGGAFAKGIEVVRKCYYRDKMDPMDAIVEGVIAAFAEYGDFDHGDKYANKSAERVGYALVEYFTEYPPGTDRIQPYYRADGKPAIEFEFSFPLDIEHPDTGNPILFGGRSDMVGDFMQSLWIVDEKTAGRLGPQWLKGFTLRGQFIGYCYAAKSFNLPINGFIVRGVSFLKDYYGHAEVIESVPQHRIDKWRRQLDKDVKRMVESYKQMDFDYSFGEACNAYGGCPFARLCEKEHWEEWWQQYFDIDYWDPLNRDKEVDPDKPILGSFQS
jgi:hypothetical protein